MVQHTHVCGNCDKQLFNVIEFLAHVSDYRNETKGFTCSLCDTVFARHATLLSHYVLYHKLPQLADQLPLRSRTQSTLGLTGRYNTTPGQLLRDFQPYTSISHPTVPAALTSKSALTTQSSDPHNVPTVIVPVSGGGTGMPNKTVYIEKIVAANSKKGVTIPTNVRSSASVSAGDEALLNVTRSGNMNEICQLVDDTTSEARASSAAPPAFDRPGVSIVNTAPVCAGLDTLGSTSITTSPISSVTATSCYNAARVSLPFPSYSVEASSIPLSPVVLTTSPAPSMISSRLVTEPTPILSITDRDSPLTLPIHRDAMQYILANQTSPFMPTANRSLPFFHVSGQSSGITIPSLLEEFENFPYLSEIIEEPRSAQPSGNQLEANHYLLSLSPACGRALTDGSMREVASHISSSDNALPTSALSFVDSDATSSDACSSLASASATFTSSTVTSGLSTMSQLLAYSDKSPMADTEGGTSSTSMLPESPLESVNLTGGHNLIDGGKDFPSTSCETEPQFDMLTEQVAMETGSAEQTTKVGEVALNSECRSSGSEMGDSSLLVSGNQPLSESTHDTGETPETGASQSSSQGEITLVIHGNPGSPDESVILRMPEGMEFLPEKKQVSGRPCRETVIGQSSLNRCGQCNRPYSRKSTAQPSKRHRTNSGAEICDTCFRARRRAALLSSRKTPQQSQPYKCGQCEFESTFQLAIRSHRQIHPNDSVICSVCAAAQKDNSTLQKHMRVHDPGRPFGCPVRGCSYRFLTETMCKAHIKFHSVGKEVDFSCTHCGYKFRKKHHLNRHELVVHKIQPHRNKGKQGRTVSIQSQQPTQLKNSTTEDDAEIVETMEIPVVESEADDTTSTACRTELSVAVEMKRRGTRSRPTTPASNSVTPIPRSLNSSSNVATPTSSEPVIDVAEPLSGDDTAVSSTYTSVELNVNSETNFNSSFSETTQDGLSDVVIIGQPFFGREVLVCDSGLTGLSPTEIGHILGTHEPVSMVMSSDGEPVNIVMSDSGPVNMVLSDGGHVNMVMADGRPVSMVMSDGGPIAMVTSNYSSSSSSHPSATNQVHPYGMVSVAPSGHPVCTASDLVDEIIHHIPSESCMEVELSVGSGDVEVGHPVTDESVIYSSSQDPGEDVAANMVVNCESQQYPICTAGPYAESSLR